MGCLLIKEDILDLAASKDFRGHLDLQLEELKSSFLPCWMVEKTQKHVETPRRENEHRAVEAGPLAPLSSSPPRPSHPHGRGHC